MELNRLIDHTILKANASLEDIERVAIEARQYHFWSVCINPCFVKVMKTLLGNSDTKVCTVIGFPLGASTPAVKALEAYDAIKNGADEIDMVINISMAKDHNYSYIEGEVKEVKKMCEGHLLKVIIESAMLTDEEIAEVCKAAVRGGAEYVKTSTGFAKEGGASVHAVEIMTANVPSHIGVKASGGIHNYDEAVAMLKAGATRIGTSSGVQIMQELQK